MEKIREYPNMLILKNMPWIAVFPEGDAR